MIDCQTFDEILPRDCELHKCFCHLSLVGQDGQGGLELGIFLSPNQSESDNLLEV